MRENFDEALRRVLAHEGGYSHHPSDPGGPTNFGITIHDFRKHLKRSASAADVRAMTVQQARAIYRAHYWDAQHCDALPAGLDYAMFDYGVNSGVGRSVRVLQRLLRRADDGRVSEALLAAARERDSAELVRRLCDERLVFLKRLKTWPVFGAGWGRRVAEVKAAALRMAARVPAVPVEQPANGAAAGKGQVAPPNAVQRGTAGGIVVAGTAAAVEAQALGARPWLIAAIVAAALALAVLAWLAWRWRHKQMQER
jgi:lysozyme family protein